MFGEVYASPNIVILEGAMKTTFLLVLVLVFFDSSPSWPAGKSPGHEKLGYRDDDNDGQNDIFRDKDGDGINDVTGKPYRHRYPYSDSDGDGRNDIFRDADGNGINDLAEQDVVRMEGISHIVIDFDENGINDVTGKQYQRHMGQRGFFDENADGIRDTREGGSDGPPQEVENVKGNDTFQDEDGDGINDGRGFGRDKRDRGGNRFTRERRRERNP